MLLHHALLVVMEEGGEGRQVLLLETLLECRSIASFLAGPTGTLHPIMPGLSWAIHVRRMVLLPTIRFEKKHARPREAHQTVRMTTVRHFLQVAELSGVDLMGLPAELFKWLKPFRSTDSFLAALAEGVPRAATSRRVATATDTTRACLACLCPITLLRLSNLFASVTL